MLSIYLLIRLSLENEVLLNKVFTLLQYVLYCYITEVFHGLHNVQSENTWLILPTLTVATMTSLLPVVINDQFSLEPLAPHSCFCVLVYAQYIQCV